MVVLLLQFKASLVCQRNNLGITMLIPKLQMLDHVLFCAIVQLSNCMFFWYSTMMCQVFFWNIFNEDHSSGWLSSLVHSCWVAGIGVTWGIIRKSTHVSHGLLNTSEANPIWVSFFKPWQLKKIRMIFELIIAHWHHGAIRIRRIYFPNEESKCNFPCRIGQQHKDRGALCLTAISLTNNNHDKPIVTIWIVIYYTYSDYSHSSYDVKPSL